MLIAIAIIVVLILFVWLFGCRPSPREAAVALNLSKDVISKAPVLVPPQDQYGSVVEDCHSDSCSGDREMSFPPLNLYTFHAALHR
jgi:hypothetical protein